MILYFLVGDLYSKEKIYHFTLSEHTLKVGKLESLCSISVNGKIPAPLLELQEEDTAIIHVKNDLDGRVHPQWGGGLFYQRVCVKPCTEVQGFMQTL